MPRKNSGHCTHQIILDGGLNRLLKFSYLCKCTEIGGKKNIMKTIWEPARQIPICWEGDICVLGGSCTGLFAAVRAARLGASVCVVEKQNCFGGMATAGLVNVWHSLYDFDDQ